jgi:hypothetical protein
VGSQLLTACSMAGPRIKIKAWIHFLHLFSDYEHIWNVFEQSEELAGRSGIEIRYPSACQSLASMLV